MARANTIVAWVKRNGFQKADAFACITSEGYRAARFRSAEERRIYKDET